MTLFLECRPDETLARALGVPRRAIVHSHSKGAVSKNLGKKTSARGLVDEDPGSSEPTTLRRFTEVSAAHDLKLKEDRARNNTLVVVYPRLEDWIIKTAKAANVKLERFNLSENPLELHADINQRLTNLARLLETLLEAKSPRLLHLKSLLPTCEAG